MPFILIAELPVGRRLRNMQRFTPSFLAFVSLMSVHCGGAVAETSAADSGPSVNVGADTGVVVEPRAEWAETASCEAVKASCTTAPAVFVRGHAEGLPGLDGARVDFAVRYLSKEGSGLEVPHGVALGRTRVKGSSFETCVCVPQGANMYPQIAAVVYRPGSTRETTADAARASFSQRYATLGDEDVSYGLNALPTDAQKAAAVAAMVERTATVTLRNVVTTGRVVAGLVADERPLASEVTGNVVSGDTVVLTWMMPGRAWASERVAFFADLNGNGKCDAADTGGFAPVSGAFDGKWLTGAGLTPVCDALQVGASRE